MVRRLVKTGSVLAVVGTVMVAEPAHGDLLGLTLLNEPDIASGFIDVTYDAGSQIFDASGFALTYDAVGPGAATNIGGGLFNIDAMIDNAGNAVSGSLNIDGTLPGFGPDLLDANLLDFGFVNGGGMILEFLFEVTGGDLAMDYGGLGNLIGVVMDIDSMGYSGDWTQSFDNLMGGPGTGGGVADTQVLPAPAALGLLGIAGLMGTRRRRATASI